MTAADDKDLNSRFPLDQADINLPTPADYEEMAQEKGAKPGPFTRVAEFLANDIVAGLILIIAAVIALVVANSPLRELYAEVSEYVLGGHALDSLHLDLTISEWARDGLLAIFFFAVGLELKHEFTHGSLRDPRTALLPILAAVFGMIGPAAVYLAVTVATGDSAWHGWAIPTATDIAFAVAILQIFGRRLPTEARTFLLTLAVADDLGGIIVIAAFYGSAPKLGWLAVVAVLAAIWWLLCTKRWNRWWILVPIGVATWYFMHASGIHATIAGVLLGLVTPCTKVGKEREYLTDTFINYVNPISAGLAVPIFAFFAAGVNIVDVEGGPLEVITHPVALSVMAALPLGKFLGIFGSVAVLTKLTPLKLGEGVTLADILPMSLVAGIGFTVALLVSHLAFVGDAELTQAGSLGVVMGTALSVVLGIIFLQIRTKQITKQLAE